MRVQKLEELIARCSAPAGAEGHLTPDDIIVHRMPINYAMKDRDPVQRTHFFHTGSDRSPPARGQREGGELGEGLWPLGSQLRSSSERLWRELT